MSRRIILRIAVAVLAAALASGCVTQPLDSAALEEATERLGADAAPLDAPAAKRVATKARVLRERHAEALGKGKKVVWTKRQGDAEQPAGEGGLVRGGQDTSGAQDDGDGSAQPPPDKGQDQSGDGDAGGGGSGQDQSTGSGDGDSDTNPDRNPPPAESEPARPPTTSTYNPIADVVDGGSDAAGQSPAYADIRQLLIESNGTRARVTVAASGSIPAELGEGEVQGVGIDFYRSDDGESDYQLYAIGGTEGWRAYLQTPQGLVQYPGTFAVGGRVLVFNVPWSALGGRKPADVDMFIDWSKRDTPLNKAGNDRAPQDGRIRITPS